MGPTAAELAFYYYSVLYYNADIWLIPSLSPALKQKLLAASSQVLRISTKIMTNDVI